MAAHRRGPWSQREDAYLCQLVHTQGALNWVRIAQLIGSRSPKQCRERYHQNLKPSLNHEPISPEEGLQIERLVAEMGKRWAEIARRLHGRSDNAVKNWWNGSMNRRRRLVVHRRASSSRYANEFSGRPDPLSYGRLVNSVHPSLKIAPGHKLDSHHTDVPLPSPSTSEASRAESVDGAPSLISDSGSAFSVSPRVATSPSTELSSLTVLGYPGNMRRPSLPSLQFASGTFTSEVDVQGLVFPHRSQSGSKNSGNFQTPHCKRPETPRLLSPIMGDSYESPPHPQTAPPTYLNLPPLQSYRYQPEKRIERDTRMHLSSLLA